VAREAQAMSPRVREERFLEASRRRCRRDALDEEYEARCVEDDDDDWAEQLDDSDVQAAGRPSRRCCTTSRSTRARRRTRSTT